MNNNLDSISVSPSITSVYNFTNITDVNNCSNSLTDAVTITVNQLPTVVVSGGGEICDDGTTVDVVFNTSYGTPTFNIEYSLGINENIISNVGYQHVIKTNEAGTYSITNVTDSKGCIAKDISGTADVIVNPLPIASFSAYPQPADITDPVINFIDNSSNHTLVYRILMIINTPTNFGKISHRFSDIDSGTYFVELYESKRLF